MKRWFFLLDLLLLPFLLEARPVELDAGNVVLTVPDDFTALTPDEVHKYFPLIHGDFQAVADAGRDITVECCISGELLYADQLKRFQSVIATAITDRVPGSRVLAPRLVPIGGTNFVWIEFTRPSRHGDRMHDIELVTSYHGRELALNVYTSDIHYSVYRERLEAICESIRFHSPPDSLLAPPS
jgi:hypothetical protein